MALELERMVVVLERVAAAQERLVDLEVGAQQTRDRQQQDILDHLNVQFPALMQSNDEAMRQVNERMDRLERLKSGEDAAKIIEEAP